MRTVAGLLEPTSGRVTLDGEDILARPERVWSRLGYLPQDFGFYPHLTGRDMLIHLLRLKGVRARAGLKRLADELLGRVNLDYAAKRRVHEYSGGMKQRLGIAQAIAGNPRLLIVDEPTAGLDPEERLRFYHLLAELAQERIVLLSTHIVEDVAVLCPFFAVIREGRIVAQSSPSAAREALAGSVYQGDFEPGQLASLRESYLVTQALLVEGRCRVRIYLPGEAAPEGFAVSEPSVEDAYLALMRTGQDILPEVRPTPEIATGSPA